MTREKTQPMKAPSSSGLAAYGSQTADTLLGCLVFLSGHFGKAKSADSILAGLAYDERGMRPELFCEAADRMALQARIVKRALDGIPSSVLPVVLILNESQSVVLLELRGKSAKIFLPETEAIRDVSVETLRRDYSGYTIFVHPRSDFHNPEIVADTDRDRHWFWSLMDQNRGLYAMVLVGALFINIFALASPLFIMNVYDRVIPNNAIETGWALGIGALTVFVFDLVMRSLRAYLIDLAGRRIDVIAARRIYDQVLNMKLAHRPRSSGAFANMLRDFDSVRDFFTSATVTGLVDLPFALFFLFIVYKLGGGIALILLGLIAAVFAIGFFIQTRLKLAVRKATQTSETKHGLLVETINALETIKAIGADGRFRARYMDYVGDNALHGQTSRFWSGLGVNLATFLQQIASIIVVLAGMYLVRDSALTMGALIACVILGGRAIAPIGQIANLMARYHQAGSALRTLNSIMAQPVERPPSKQFLHRPDLKGRLAFENVSFSYPAVKNKVLSGVSFHIESGEKVGIIGRIGSGKSTIARLIMGLYEPDEGKILIDDTDYQQLDPADLRRHMAYISQDITLFSGSVRDNIAISLPGASEAQILAAAKASGVHDFIARHPMGYDAPVGERGEGLSGGQRQSIALARAILLNPCVMVCDEPTNALDMQAEQAFRDVIARQSAGKTLVLITHKHPLLDLVDRLILIEQGRVLMDGARESVIEALQNGKVGVPR